MSLLDGSQSLDGFCSRCGGPSCDKECRIYSFSPITLPPMTSEEEKAFCERTAEEVKLASLNLMASAAEEPKIVHKFDDPYSWESIACKDPEWTGYGADNWDKINCKKCLALKGKNE